MTVILPIAHHKNCFFCISGYRSLYVAKHVCARDGVVRATNRYSPIFSDLKPYLSRCRCFFIPRMRLHTIPGPPRFKYFQRFLEMRLECQQRTPGFCFSYPELTCWAFMPSIYWMLMIERVCRPQVSALGAMPIMHGPYNAVQCPGAFCRYVNIQLLGRIRRPFRSNHTTPLQNTVIRNHTATFFVGTIETIPAPAICCTRFSGNPSIRGVSTRQSPRMCPKPINIIPNDCSPIHPPT